MDKFAQLLVNGLLVGLLYSLVAQGFVLIRKGSGIINFAQGELILVAGYLVAWLLTDFDLPILVAVVVTIGLMAFLGLSVERLVLRPMENESLLSLAMANTALGIVLRDRLMRIERIEAESLGDVEYLYRVIVAE